MTIRERAQMIREYRAKVLYKWPIVQCLAMHSLIACDEKGDVGYVRNSEFDNASL